MDYQKIYNDLISKRKEFPLKKSKDLCTEEHHIVPRCLGGSDEPGNLVRLTAREHFVAHMVLTQIYPSSKELHFAAWHLSHTSDGRIVNSILYEKLKARQSIEKSEQMKIFWDSADFRDKMRLVSSTTMKALWGSQEFRNLVSETARERWKDEKFRERVTESCRKSMISLNRDPEFIKKKNEGYISFLKSNPWPWMHNRAKPSKHVWALAATFWELSRFNPNNETFVGVKEFAEIFLGGGNIGIVQRMSNMFRDGWVPQKCNAYLKDFGDKM